MTTSKRTFMKRSGEIDWYCEQSGQGPDVVLIPSGEGDCSAFDKVAAILAQTFTVTTFDTPGFSRSGAPADPTDISTLTLGPQIASLIRSLDIKNATIYGCSSGGMATLDLAVHFPEIVRNVIIHEIASPDPQDIPPSLTALGALDDAGIVAACGQLFETFLNEDPALWRALGADYHARLKNNYVTWVRRYIQGTMHAPLDPRSLTGRPITWTIGSLSMVAAAFSNVRISHRAGIELGCLPCRHFPQVSIPDQLAAHIRRHALPMQG